MMDVTFTGHEYEQRALQFTYYDAAGGKLRPHAQLTNGDDVKAWTGIDTGSNERVR